VKERKREAGREGGVMKCYIRASGGGENHEGRERVGGEIMSRTSHGGEE